MVKDCRFIDDIGFMTFSRNFYGGVFLSDAKRDYPTLLPRRNEELCKKES